MANGILGRNELAATTNTTVYTVPADTFSVVTINVANRTTAPRTIRIGPMDQRANADYIEYEVEIFGNGKLERTGIVMDAGKTLCVMLDGLGLFQQVSYGKLQQVKINIQRRGKYKELSLGVKLNTQLC